MENRLLCALRRLCLRFRPVVVLLDLLLRPTLQPLPSRRLLGRPPQRLQCRRTRWRARLAQWPGRKSHRLSQAQGRSCNGSTCVHSAFGLGKDVVLIQAIGCTAGLMAGVNAIEALSLEQNNSGIERACGGVTHESVNTRRRLCIKVRLPH